MEPGVQLVQRGETMYGPSQTIDTSDYGVTAKQEGMPLRWTNTDPTDPTKTLSENDVFCVLVRNVSGITLMPSMTVTWASGFIGRRVDGYARTTAVAIAGIVDDHLSVTTGVRNGDMFWLMVKGKVLAYTGTSTFTNDIWAAGDFLYAITAAASTANTTGGTTADDAGNLINWNAVGTFTETQTTDGTLLNLTRNAFAKAISAATSGETRTRKLVDLDVRI